MNTAEPAYRRLVAANPIPNPEQYLQTVVDLEAVWHDIDEAIADAKTHERPDRVPLRRRQWRVATAAFLAVLVIGGLFSLVTLSDRGDVATDTPLGVVEVFFERWNTGDVDEAMALTGPDVVINALPRGGPVLRGFIEWTVQLDGTMETDCSPGLTSTLVTCDWAFVSAATEALGLTGSETSFSVVDGVITEMATPDYRVLENQLASFAKTEDPKGYTEACSPDGTSATSLFGFPFNEECGQFLADLEPAFVAQING